MEIGSRPPFLVREWVNGLNLASILRLKEGTLGFPETAVLLDPFPELLDTVASSGLSLVMVSLSNLWVRLPPELEDFDPWVKLNAPDHWKDRLALDPFSLRRLVSKSVHSENDVTLIPTSRSLALQQTRAGIQGRTPTQLLARVIYELLSGRPPQSGVYRPLSAIPELANQTLKRGLTEEGHFPSATAFWQTFQTEIPLTPIRPAAPAPQPSAPVAHSNQLTKPRKPWDLSPDYTWDYTWNPHYRKFTPPPEYGGPEQEQAPPPENQSPPQPQPAGSPPAPGPRGAPIEAATQVMLSAPSSETLASLGERPTDEEQGRIWDQSAFSKAQEQYNKAIAEPYNTESHIRQQQAFYRLQTAEQRLRAKLANKAKKGAAEEERIRQGPDRLASPAPKPPSKPGFLLRFLYKLANPKTPQWLAPKRGGDWWRV